jgi:tRNA 2-thiouridine synthesizing protein A
MAGARVTLAIVTTVDARGLLCPLPLTMARRRMAGLSAGETLVVLATDPEAPIDIAAWAAEEGHAYEERERAGFTEFALVKLARRPRARAPADPR